MHRYFKFKKLKSQNSNPKKQIKSNDQKEKFKTKNSKQKKYSFNWPNELFGHCNFGNYFLFVICYLDIGIFYIEDSAIFRI